MLNQKLFPACEDMKSFEKFLKSDYKIGVILETHIAQVKHIINLANRFDKKILLHMDLINGIKNNEYGTEYICQEFKPYGVISTKANVILKAKQKGIISIQRMFLIDSHAVNKSLSILAKTQPDYVEVLPGILHSKIASIKSQLNIPILAGGLISKIEEIEQALEAGATGITTSNIQLWKTYRSSVNV